MGMDLLREGVNERFSAISWCECLKRAIEFGWTPEGTVAPLDFPGQWDGDYCGNDFQQVTDRDARGLGEALLRAVAALSAREQSKIEVLKDCSDDEVEWTAKRPLVAELSCLRRLANYTLQGGFVIT